MNTRANTDAGGFLGRLATRGAAGIGGALALRPDPWRGREVTPVEGASDSEWEADVPGLMATAMTDSSTSHPTEMAVVSVSRPPAARTHSAGPATTETALPMHRREDNGDVRPETHRVAAGEQDAVLEPYLPARQQATETEGAELSGKPHEPDVTYVTSELVARPASPIPIAEIAPRAIEPVPRAPTSVNLSPATDAADPPAIEITIGRIELCNAPPPVPPRVTTPASAPATGFAAYSRLRAGIDSGRR